MSQEQFPSGEHGPSQPQERPVAPAQGQPAPGQPVNGQSMQSPRPAPGQPMPGYPAPSGPTTGHPAPSQPMPGHPAPNQPAPGRPMQGQPAQGRPMQSQPAPVQAAPGQAARQNPQAVRGVQTPQPDASVPFNPPRSHQKRVGVDPFSPEGVEFKGVSPGLMKVRVTTTLITAAIFLLVTLFLRLFFSDWIWIIVGIEVILFGWLLWLVPRQVRAIGYAEAESDLLIRSGIMFKKMTVVPYGRMQYVDVSEGPIARMFGIAEVQLHTASAGTDATIPGLPAAEAARLRTRLAERGEAEMAGL